MKNFGVLVLGLLLASNAFAAQKWSCDSGVKNNWDESTAVELQPKSNGKHELIVSRLVDGKLWGPIVLASDVKCRFAPAENGQVGDCSYINPQNDNESVGLLIRKHTVKGLSDSGSVSIRDMVVLQMSADKVGKAYEQLRLLGGVENKYQISLEVKVGSGSQCGFN